MKLLKNKTTRSAIIFTLFILVIYRIGFYTISPIVDGGKILATPLLGGTLDTIFNFMGGGNIKLLSVFALGVSPYITASIIIQLLENDLVPSISEWKHQGVDGQNKRQAWTKYLGIILAFVQALAITLGFYLLKSLDVIRPIPFSDNSQVGLLEFVVIALFMTAGTAIMIWLADRITEKGVGNGMSVMIMIGIVARMPVELQSILQSIKDAAYNGVKGLDVEFLTTFLMWVLIGLIFVLLVILIIYYTLAYRKININYVKNSKSKLSENNYIPIKLNPAGVIPVIFVVPLMQVPLLILKLPTFASNGIGKYETIVRAFFDVNGNHWYVAIVVYFLLVVGFSIMYSYIQMNPENMAENLEKQSAYIVGIRPGKDTEEYLTNVITKTTIYGGIVLAILAILPTLIEQVFNTGIRLNLIGTGLIITVNVLVQTYQSMENKTEAKTYKRLF